MKRRDFLKDSLYVAPAVFLLTRPSEAALLGSFCKPGKQVVVPPVRQPIVTRVLSPVQGPVYRIQVPSWAPRVKAIR
jgi:hypothetical protein